MPSKDTYHSRHPEVNSWLEGDGLNVSARPTAGKRIARNVSAQIMRLAQRLGVSPDELAQKIPADTVRRTKYPVIEVVNEDGTRSFQHDPGITEGPISAAR